MVLPDLLQGVLFTDPYMTITAALIVRDHQREETVDRVRRRDFEGFRVGVTRAATDRPVFNQVLPGVTMVAMPMLPEYLDGSVTNIDAALWAAETGSAWTLVYPAFSVVPIEPLYRVPVTFPVARGEFEFVEMLNAWLAMMEASGDRQRLYDYWVLGRDEQAHTPRWSIVRDVLSVGRTD